MSMLNDLLLKCVAECGPVLNITPGKPPWIHVHGKTRELDAVSLTPEGAKAMIGAILSVAERGRLEQEEHLKFDYVIQDTAGQPLTFYAYAHIAADGTVHATFRYTDRFPATALEPPPEPWPRGGSGSAPDQGGGAPVPAPVGPRVPVRWGHDAKPIPKEGEIDDNPAAQ